MQKLTLCLAALTLTACGTLREETDYRDVFVAARSLLTPAEATEGSRIELTRAMVDQLPGDVLIVESYDGANRVVMVPAVVNLNRVTWLSEDNVSIVTENGLIVATRGLPRDLMAADVIESRRAILNNGGEVVRKHETLSDLDQIQTELLQCSIAPQGSELITIVEKPIPTTRFVERCIGKNTPFTNTYWTDESGVIIRSDQMVSAEAGSLRLERP